MKIKLFLCFIVIFLSFSITNVEAKRSIIVIDPGHGGMDGGASYNEILEKNINLEISKRLKLILEDEGYEVILTRDSDEDLSGDEFIKKEDMINRVNIINSSNAILCISIHLNYFTDSAYSGAQVFYSNINSFNYYLASFIQSSLEEMLNNTNREIVLRDNIYLLNHSLIPTALVECGFLSNKKERELLCTEEYQILLARAIYFGIRRSILGI